MAEVWHFRDGGGAICGPGDRRELSLVEGTGGRDRDITTERTWNRTESARSIATGTWTVDAQITTGDGGGAANKVTIVIERRNSSCVVQETIFDIEVAMTRDTECKDYAFSQAGVAQIDFTSGDILTVRVVRSAGARDNDICFDGAAPNQISTLDHPDETAGGAPRRVFIIT